MKNITCRFKVSEKDFAALEKLKAIDKLSIAKIVEESVRRYINMERFVGKIL